MRWRKGRTLLAFSCLLLAPACVAPSHRAPRVPQALRSEPAAGGTYVVQPGDTLYSIARSHGTAVAELLRLNPGVNPRDMEVGTRLLLPGGKPAFRNIENRAGAAPEEKESHP